MIMQLQRLQDRQILKKIHYADISIRDIEDAKLRQYPLAK